MGRNCEAGEVAGENFVRTVAALCEPRRADDAQADAVARAVAAEAVRAVFLAQLERRALYVLPAERPADRDAQILSGNPIRFETVQPQLGHPPRRVVCGDRHVAELAAESRRPGRALQVGVVQLR